MSFTPNYQNIIDAAMNKRPERLPLYEHYVSSSIMEQITGSPFVHLENGNLSDRRNYYQHYNSFFLDMGYDTVSYERGVCGIVQDSQALMGQRPGIIRNRGDFGNYSFDDSVERFFQKYTDDFDLFVEALPPGMKAIGGIGNGIFEVVQDFVGYADLCLLSVDDQELYADIFDKVGRIIHDIWKEFLTRYGDFFAVCRIGDDLGFKASTLLSPQDIRTHIIPHYTRIVKLIHSHEKPFLLHSCGSIFDVMDDFIDTVGIDAKHSNEDVIAPFHTWVERYGERIGNFGGIDMGVLCDNSPGDVERLVTEIIESVDGNGGIAFSTGNSVPDYVPPENYVAMIRAVREYRGDSLPANWPRSE